MMFNPMEVRRYEPIEYDEMPGEMVTAADYDALVSLFKEVVCFRCKRSEEIDAMGMCLKHKLMAYPTETGNNNPNRSNNNSDLT